jgi:DNA repair protein SbcD/Mre11
MQGGETSDSERPIIIGHEEALSTALFDDVIDYVALGHLHKPQKVGHAHIRYSGSPIPLSFSEINYKHQVLDLTIDPNQQDESRFQIESLIIPRSVQLHRIKGTIAEVLTQLSALASGEIDNIDQREYVEIEYHTDTPPAPNLRQQFEEALAPNRYRLVRISRRYLNTDSNDQQQTAIHLDPPTPEKLFQNLWDKQGYGQDEKVMTDFLSLVNEAQKSLEDDASV